MQIQKEYMADEYVHWHTDAESEAYASSKAKVAKNGRHGLVESIGHKSVTKRGIHAPSDFYRCLFSFTNSLLALDIAFEIDFEHIDTNYAILFLLRRIRACPNDSVLNDSSFCNGASCTS